MIRLFPKGRAGIALALLMLFESGLFAQFHYRRWHDVIIRAGQPDENRGEGLVIRGNGLGYYAWLRSALVDYDWDFDNEFDEHNVEEDFVPPRTYRTELGRRANQWSVGPACIWAIVVVPGHHVLMLLGDFSPWAVDGYSLPYQFMVGASSLITCWFGILLLYRICLEYARPSRAALATAFLTLGSTLVYYSSLQVSMAHGPGAAVLAGLVWYWLKTYGSLCWSRWFILGLLVGAAALMRWQLATFAFLPAGEAILGCARTRIGLGKQFARLAMVSLGALLAFLPQMIAWHAVYGYWLVQPIPQIAHHWLNPSVWDILLSPNRSLFCWTPICLLAFVGHFVGRPSVRDEPAALLLVAFFIQVYALASVWGKGDFIQSVGNNGGVFLARAYGMRHLTEAVITLAPGLAMLFERGSFRIYCSAGFILTICNLLLLCYNQRLVTPGARDNYFLALSHAPRVLAADPWYCLALLEELALICFVLLWRNTEQTKDMRETRDERAELPRYAIQAIRWGILTLLLTALILPMF
jgi:hypothetical protein